MDQSTGDTLASLEPEKPERVLANIGRRIAELRQRRGWTQQEMAEEINMPLKNLQRYESGRQNFHVSTLVRLARGLGVRTADFFKSATTKAPRRGRPRSHSRT